MTMLALFGDHFLSTLTDVIPIVSMLFVFQLLVLKKPINNLRRVVLGFFYVCLGLTLFLMGLDQALFPLGDAMAQQLTSAQFLHSVKVSDGVAMHWVDYYWVYLFAFAIGFSTTIAEPSLIAIAMKANLVSAGSISVLGLRVAVALGVAIGISLGCYRIVAGDPLQYYIIGGYLVVAVQTYYAPRLIIPLAYDSGGVTTSTVTVPLVTALGLGLASGVPERNPLIDGFGLIAFASLFPIITVMGYAQVSRWLSRVRSAKEKKDAL